jgi:gliding motility-associated-like protein
MKLEFTQLSKITAIASLLLCSFYTQAQTFNDGAMQVEMAVGYSWVESVDDPLTGELNANEFRFRWWAADNANLDGQGFLGGNTIGVNSGGAGWVLAQDVNLFNFTYGPAGSTPVTVPQYMQLQGEAWEDDCFDCYRSTGTFSWECDQCSSNIFDGGCGCSGNILCGCSAEDQHCGPTTLTSTINYRAIPPCLGLFSPNLGNTNGSAFVGDYFSNVCGNDDIGAEVLVRWTPPIPSPITATASVLCQPSLVTLQSGGAVFGGDYRWYNNTTNILVGTGAQITPFVGTTTTFRVHTLNGACESLSFRLITITVGQPLINSVTSTNPLCNGVSNGSITINASGGNGALQYSINGGGTWQPSNVFNNLAAGFYNIWVRDASGCTVIYSGNSVVLTQPQPISIFINKVDATCNGASTGRIEVLAGGGSGNLTYSVNGGSSFQPSSIFNNLTAGSYNVQVQDANGCISTFLGNPVIIAQPTAVSATAIAIDASCAGNNNGTVNVVASGGTSPYNYSLNNGPFFANPSFTGLLAGTYNVLVADVNGCQGTTTATISNTYTFTANVQSQTDVSCSGGADGSITASQTGGVAPFEYSINGGTTWQNSPTFNGLSGGVYTVLVKDFNNCQDNVSVTIIEKPALVATVTAVSAVNCAGDSTGSITTNVTGGDGVYTYSWSNGTITQNLTGVPSGTYTLTVTDGASCTAIATATITSNLALILQLEKNVSVLCHGGNSGALDVTVNGGIAPYTYNWSNSATTEDIFGVTAGGYTINVTDALGCTITENYFITQPPVDLTGSAVATNALCAGQASGSVTASGLGGTTPYIFQWNNGQSGPTINNVAPGLYVVNIIDSNNCVFTTTATVTAPSALVASGVVTSATCSGSSTGGVTLTVTGGTTPYTFAWSNNTASQNLTGVIANTYTVTITDANNCTLVQSFIVTEAPSLLTSVSGNNPDCFGNATGFAVANAAGGTPPYNFTWSTTPAQNGIMGVKLLGDVTYFVSVNDANNCQVIDSVRLVNPTPVTVVTVPINVKCFEGNNGEITIQASGGSSLYEYYLNGVFQTSPVFTGLTAGTYTAVAEDNENCVGSTNITITQPQGFTVNAGADLVSVKGQTVQLTGTATSANGILSYDWTPAATLSCTSCQNPNATPDSTTTYVLLAMDGDSCIGFDSVTVFVKYTIQYFIPNAFTPNDDKLNDFFEFDILGAKSIETSIFNRWGERVYFNANQSNGAINGNAWDGKKDGKVVPSDTYLYQLKVSFFDDTEVTLSGTISVVR